VALDLERARPPIAHVDDPGVLARPLHHAPRPGRPRPLGRQPLQMDAAALVRTMLAPHHAEDSQLGQARHAPHLLLDARVLLRRNAVRLQQLGRDPGWRGNGWNNNF